MRLDEVEKEENFPNSPALEADKNIPKFDYRDQFKLIFKVRISLIVPHVDHDQELCKDETWECSSSQQRCWEP